MIEEPSQEEIMVKFRALMEVVMTQTKTVKDLRAIQYALTATLDTVREELSERKRVMHV